MVCHSAIELPTRASNRTRCKASKARVLAVMALGLGLGVLGVSRANRRSMLGVTLGTTKGTTQATTEINAESKRCKSRMGRLRSVSNLRGGFAPRWPWPPTNPLPNVNWTLSDKLTKIPALPRDLNNKTDPTVQVLMLIPRELLDYRSQAWSGTIQFSFKGTSKSTEQAPNSKLQPSHDLIHTTKPKPMSDPDSEGMKYPAPPALTQSLDLSRARIHPHEIEASSVSNGPRMTGAGEEHILSGGRGQSQTTLNTPGIPATETMEIASGKLPRNGAGASPVDQELTLFASIICEIVPGLSIQNMPEIRGWIASLPTYLQTALIILFIPILVLRVMILSLFRRLASLPQATLTFVVPQVKRLIGAVCEFLGFFGPGGG
ncbi:hypothetical protein AAMO2058_000638500 [Amorphochlora amoebiformis]